MKKIVLLSLSALCACKPIPPIDYTAADSKTCSSYGFKKKTDGYANCLMQQQSLRVQQESSNRQAAAAQWQASQQLLQAGQVHANPSPVQMPMNCQTTYNNTRYGFSPGSSTTCY